MATVSQIRCDQCGKMSDTKPDHWFSITISDSRLLIVAHGNFVPGADVLDLCGEACVLKTVSKFLTR